VRRMWAAGAAVLICVVFEGPITMAQEAESPASPSPVPTMLVWDTAPSMLTVELADLVGMEGLELGIWDLCYTGPSTGTYPIPVLRNLPIDASPFEASERLGLPICPTGFHELIVGVAERPLSDWQYACFTRFDLSSGEDIWIRIVGLPPTEAEAPCALAYIVHDDPAPMSW
jgi:hypothetical protein